MTEQGFRVEQDLQDDRKLDGVKLIALDVARGRRHGRLWSAAQR